MDILRASSIVKALPFISKTIVDDTLYEKVLSYLTLVLSQSTETDIQTLNEASPIFEHIKQVLFSFYTLNSVNSFSFFNRLVSIHKTKIIVLPLYAYVY